ncbi:ComF family protein [Oculatella sp. LEGE 06141]|uniref:ComF family protein n=1 Tax=Oculatella sp. LEGE 06141 TaxID=1828648 RepID=UPI001D14B435|nr:ComF family protein [Oculatella sp. LEGE 06141]
MDCQRQVQRCQLHHFQPSERGSLPLLAWGGYEGALKRSLAALKYNNSPQLARPLGHWLAQAWLESPLVAVKPITVVPIPMHEAKKRQRGFNQAELLAEAFCDVAKVPLQRHGLVRVRETEAQFRLSATERSQNLANAFEVNESLRDGRPQSAVLLLDDIYTTGATANAAVAALRRHRVAVCGMVAVAKS